MALSGTGQREYTLRMKEGLPGQLWGENHQIEPLFLESGTCPFGYGVAAGTGEREAVLPSAGKTIADFRGVTYRRATIERDYRSEDDPVYNADYEKVMDVVRKGGIVVVPTAIITRGDPVYWQIVTSGSNYAGTFRNTADGGNAIDISSVASWFRGTSTAGDIALLEVHIV